MTGFLYSSNSSKREEQYIMKIKMQLSTDNPTLSDEKREKIVNAIVASLHSFLESTIKKVVITDFVSTFLTYRPSFRTEDRVEFLITLQDLSPRSEEI